MCRAISVTLLGGAMVCMWIGWVARGVEDDGDDIVMLTDEFGGGGEGIKWLAARVDQRIAAGTASIGREIHGSGEEARSGEAVRAGMLRAGLCQSNC
jgi:hypothetical protein